jgi:hypothetical protein
MDPDRTKDWRELCRAAARELDPAKLMDLIARLTRALDERDKSQRKTAPEITDNQDSGTGSLRTEAVL